MRIGIVLTPPTDLYFRWAAQIGVTDFVCRYPRHYGLDPLDGLTHMHARAKSFGLRLSVVEGYLPIDQIQLNGPGREAQIDEVIAFIRHMGKLGVEVLCYNWMPGMDWNRTSFHVRTRAGSITNGFDLASLQGKLVPPNQRIEAGRLWDNLVSMLKRIVPVAEDAGVKLAMHPDDPPIASIMGTSQVMCDVESFERLVQAVPSHANGICFCQGTFAEMGADIPATIRRLGKHIHYVHFRDVQGTVPRFEERFHDDGMTDMPAAVRAYHDIGYRGPLRPDHVPKLEGEDGDGNGYTMLGRLFAVGYIRGLLHAVYGKAR